ncbi:helix-turn-helix domain-containing protein [Aquabacterium sp.]|uniref:helix-turn-helix domain-containing protein n=1 Tax=Aquabacterium sp. TaxID=1872578 RepID=UPI002C849313|nr:helix-turn-helix transcriptional regulator [Aquabacterium sp.]HSW05881.1 helix-turn-helix transcriptional regulator [Aquabacterium sp.]
MITNQRQYLVSQGQAERFRQALAAPDAQGLHPKAAKAMRAGLRSQLDDLDAEIAEYDALRHGHITSLEAESIVGIGAALVKARIVRNLTQKELAERLELAEQQVQRYEATQYRGVAAERLQQVADALRLTVREVFTLEPG